MRYKCGIIEYCCDRRYIVFGMVGDAMVLRSNPKHRYNDLHQRSNERAVTSKM